MQENFAIDLFVDLKIQIILVMESKIPVLLKPAQRASYFQDKVLYEKKF